MVPIIGRQEERSNLDQTIELFDATGGKLRFVGEPTKVLVGQVREVVGQIKEKTAEVKAQIMAELEKEEVVGANVDVLSEIERLKARVAELKGEVVPSTEAKAEVKEDSKVPKNKRRVKSNPDRKYVRLGELKTWGKVPQQQADLAAIMAESMDLGAEWTEEEVFELVKDSAKEHESLRKSKQDPTYLFRYYRGLKNDGKHAGFIARGFLRMS